MVVNQNGNIGIGETSPDELLHISSATSQKPVIKLEQTANMGNGAGITFLSSGNADDNDIPGTIRFKGMNDASQETEYSTIYAKNIDVSDGTEDGELHFRTISNGTLDSRLVIRSDKVGIGHSNPQQPFEVKLDPGELAHFGGSQIDADGEICGIALGFANDGNYNQRKTAIVAKSRGDGVKRQDLHFLVDTTNDNFGTGIQDSKMFIHHTTGYVGINKTATSYPYATTDPTSALDVTGTIRASADVVAYYSSDERLKENIKTIENPIEKVKQIRGVEFDWKEGYEDIHHNEGHDIGLIAQDVEKVVPEIVMDREDGYKGIRYEKMVGLLIEGMKEQQKQIEELKSEIQELKDGSSK